MSKYLFVSLSPLGLAKPGDDVMSPERARRSEFERPSEAASRNMREHGGRREGSDTEHW